MMKASRCPQHMRHSFRGGDHCVRCKAPRKGSADTHTAEESRRVLNHEITEKQHQDRIVELCHRLGYYVYHTYDSRKSESGYPDLTIIRGHGKPVIFIEVKSERGKLTPAQLKVGSLLLDSKEVVYLFSKPSQWDLIELLLVEDR